MASEGMNLRIKQPPRIWLRRSASDAPRGDEGASSWLLGSAEGASLVGHFNALIFSTMPAGQLFASSDAR